MIRTLERAVMGGRRHLPVLIFALVLFLAAASVFGYPGSDGFASPEAVMAASARSIRLREAYDRLKAVSPGLASEHSYLERRRASSSRAGEGPAAGKVYWVDE